MTRFRAMLLALLLMAGVAPAAPPGRGTDLLCYTTPAANWLEALPIGNGRLGGMVWGDAVDERIDLNDDTLWSGEPSDGRVNPRGLASMPRIKRLILNGDDENAKAMIERDVNGENTESYQPLGALSIHSTFSDKPTNYRRQLDLANATASVEFDAGGVHFTRETFASRPADAIVMRFTANQPGKINFSAALDSPQHHRTLAKKQSLAMLGHAPVHVDPNYVKDGKVTFDDLPGGKGMRFESRIFAINEGGAIHLSDSALIADSCNAVTLIFINATSYNGPFKSPSAQGQDPDAMCDEFAAMSRHDDYADLRKEHIADYCALYNRVSIYLGSSAAATRPTDQRVAAYQPGSDPAFAALYFNFGRYLLISCSRGDQPANLQGLWNAQTRPPWASNYTLNCNTEINYWPAESTNLPECVDPLISMTQELSLNGAKIAENLYGARGWVAHHNTDIWRQAGPVAGSAQWTIFQVGSAWLCQQMWEHYAFTGDRDYLVRIWPTLKGAAQFYLDAMVEEPTHHWLVTCPDTNFECVYQRPDGSRGTVCMGPTGSMQMVRQLFLNCIAASGILGIDADFRAQLQAAVVCLPPMRISPTTGQLQEWLADWQRVSDCQVLSSWGLICADQITPRKTPELAAALRKSFDDGSWWKKGKLGSWEGSFQANAYARLHDGDTALAILDAHLQHAVNCDLLAAFPGHTTYQIDGNFGMTAAITEMLLQSQTGEIELLPALPSSWREGSVRGLRARGGFTLDITWRDARLLSATIESPGRDAIATVRYGESVVTLDLKSRVPVQIDPAQFRAK